MSSNIIEILKHVRHVKEKRAEVYKKILDKNRQQKQQEAQVVISGKEVDNGLSVEANCLRTLYYSYLKSYKGELHSFDVGLTKHGKALWSRVEQASKKADCSAERYLKAQFVWFDKAFKKAPTLQQLATETAIERAREFTGNTEGRVLGNCRKAPITKAETFKAAEKTLQRMLLAQKCNREDFYRKFVITGLFSFPMDFLKADPAYQRAKI